MAIEILYFQLLKKSWEFVSCHLHSISAWEGLMQYCTFFSDVSILICTTVILSNQMIMIRIFKLFHFIAKMIIKTANNINLFHLHVLLYHQINNTQFDTFEIEPSIHNRPFIMFNHSS